MSKEVISAYQKQNGAMFLKHPKCQSELFNIAYGVYVSKLLKEADNNDPEVVNTELDLIGYKMGQRMIDEFFSRCDRI